MKKTLNLALSLALVMCICLLPAAATFESEAAGKFLLSESEMRYLDSIKEKAITFAVTSEMTYYTNPDGIPDGLLSPFVNLLEHELGLNVRIVNCELKDGFDLLDTGTVDMLGLSILNEARRDVYYSTDTLYDSYTYFYAREESTLTNLVELEGKRIGILSYSVLPGFISAYTDRSSSLHGFDTVHDMIAALENREIDCFASALTIEKELLLHPDIALAICAENIGVSQGVYAKSERLAPLMDIINRYLGAAQGKAMLETIKSNRSRCALELYRRHYISDIEKVQSQFRTVKIFDSGTLYPLSYVEHGEYRGLQREINKVFSELTGLTVETVTPESLNSSGTHLVDALLNGDIQAAAGTYRFDVLDGDGRFAISKRMMTDRISFYALNGRSAMSLTDANIGVLTRGDSFIDWKSISEKEPVQYAYRDELIAALKNKQVDAIMLGEMATDYYYTVLGGYMLERVGTTSIPTSVNMLFLSDNKSLNTLFDLSIRLYGMINPTDRHLWMNSSQNAKFEQMQVKSELYVYQQKAARLVYGVGSALILILAFVYYQYTKFKKYDNQISMLLSAKGNADMMWGNLKTGKLVSKGGYPIAKRYGAEREYIDSVANMAVFRSDVEEINKQRLEYIQHDVEVAVSKCEAPIYIRRFTYKINDREFMSYFADITAEMFRESELNKLANTDSLTKLLNRRAISRLIVERLENARSSSKFYFFMFDIDNFKNINDTYGHDIGDKVLVFLSDILKQKYGDQFVARWGGEEFLGFAELDRDEQAVSLAESTLKEFAGTVFPIGDRTTLSATVSCGVSALTGKETYNDAITRADNALYIAKREGKNCVRLVERDSANVVFSYYRKTDASRAASSTDSKTTYSDVIGQALRVCSYKTVPVEIILSILKITAEKINLSYARILEAPGSDSLVLTHCYSLQEGVSVQEPIPCADIPCLNTLSSGIPRFVSNAGAERVTAVIAYVPPHAKSYAVFPLISDGRLIGIAEFVDCASTRAWSVEDGRILSDITILLIEAVSRKHLVEQLNHIGPA